MKCIVCLMTALILFAVYPAVADDDGWKLVMDKNGIKAYKRDVEGTPIQEIRAVTTIDATLENIGEVLRDVPANVEWQPNCIEAELLTMHHRNKLDIYFAFGLPWPVKNRDLIVRSDTQYALDAGRAIVHITAIEDPRRPPRDDRVRITDFSGTYVFEYIDRYKTGIIYTYRLDLGGRVPAWLMNLVGKYTLYDTFTNLRKMVARPEYIEAGLQSEDRELCESILNDDDKIRTVFHNRLSEFIGDRAFVGELVNDDHMLERFFSAEGGLAEVLLFGWGSEDSKREAIRQILQVYLPGKIKDPERVRRLAADQNLVEALRRGDGAAMQIIRQAL